MSPCKLNEMAKGMNYSNTLYFLCLKQFFLIIVKIMVIWSKMAQLELEESSEVEGFRRPKYTQMKAEFSI